MSAISPNLALDYLVNGQDQPEQTINDNFNVIDAQIHLAVISRTTDAEPGSPSNGDRYIVGPTPSGDNWTGHAGDLAIYYDGWRFYTPVAGWRALIVDEGVVLTFNGTQW